MKTYSNAHIAAITKLAENSIKHLVDPKLAQIIGLEESIVLLQINYWLMKCGRSINNQLWIYNTFENWNEQFSYWSASKIYNIIKRLKNLGLIITDKKNSSKGNQTNWYTINYHLLCEKLESISPSNLQIAAEENDVTTRCSKNKNNLLEKNFAFCQTEKPFCQSDKIIISNTKNNLHKNIFISNGTNFTTETADVGKNNIEKQKKLFLKKERKNSVTPAKEATSTITESEKAICDSMINTWNKTFVKEGFKTTYTDKRAKKFLELWHSIMEQNIEKWKDFCLKINSSQFLMGEKVKSFKAYCDWVLKEEIVNRIIAGEFGIGDRVPEITAEAKRIATEEYRIKRLQEQQELKKKKEEEREIRSLSWKLRREAIDKIISNWNADKRQEMELEFEQYIQDLDNSMLQDCYRKEKFNSFIVEFNFDNYILEKAISVQDRAFEEKARQMITEGICSGLPHSTDQGNAVSGEI